MLTAIDDDILAELRERDLEVQQLRVQLHDRGHRVPEETVYERLVHLEAAGRLRLDAACERKALWGAR
jgi:Fe2+ or Zn2+ uptake regulation protein